MAVSLLPQVVEPMFGLSLVDGGVMTRAPIVILGATFATATRAAEITACALRSLLCGLIVRFLVSLYHLYR